MSEALVQAMESYSQRQESWEQEEAFTRAKRGQKQRTKRKRTAKLGIRGRRAKSIQW